MRKCIVIALIIIIIALVPISTATIGPHHQNMNEISKLFFEYKFKNVILTKPGLEKGSNLPYLIECVENLNKETENQIAIQFDENPEKAILNAFQQAYKENEPLLICGSFYLLAEVKHLLKNLQVD